MEKNDEVFKSRAYVCPCVRAVELRGFSHLLVESPLHGGSTVVVVPPEEDEDEELFGVKRNDKRLDVWSEW